MVVIRSLGDGFVADDNQVLRVKRLVSHMVPSLDYEVRPGPGFTVIIRDSDQDRLAPGIPSQIEEIIGGSVTVSAT